MTYRDERDALHAQNEALQSELEQTRRELARMRAQTPGADGAQEPEPDPRAWSQHHAELQRGAVARMMLGSVLLATGLVGALAVRHHAVQDGYYHGYSSSYGGRCTRRAFYEPAHVTGRVTQAVHSAAAVGARCTVDVTPTPTTRTTNCRVEVRCGDATLYGRAHAGYAQCDAAQGRPYRATDRLSSDADRDPELKLDLTEGRVLVRDAVDGSSTTIALEP